MKVPVQIEADVDFWALVRYLSSTELSALDAYLHRELKLRAERIARGLDRDTVEAGRKS